ncbi:MAG: MATE family efflux transporter [Roseitalea sp.]|jgi:MATE family multidrug resistance protein|nr:MATE family efflux transporter [Roseitalea sp.]MBO6720649.1 MATE family efflux transporter [Roseitalea sp.]MBO6743796.1 MATE family efflux transporter [Roseitalea sp.]
MRTSIIKQPGARSLTIASVREVPGIAALAVPIIVGMMATTLMGVIDTILIAPLGTQALAATGITTSVLIIFYSALHGLMSVIHVRMAQANGAGENVAVSAAVRTGFVVALVAGGLGMLLMLAAFPLLRILGQPDRVMEVLWPYWVAKSGMLVPFTLLAVLTGLFNATGRPWTATSVAMLGALVHLPVSYGLIHGGPGWQGLGLLGAGIGSVVASLIALVTAWTYWRRSATMAPFRRRASVSRSEVRRGLAEGLPVSLSFSGEASAYALAGLMLGLFGPTALAANQVVHSIAAILYMVPLGMTVAVSIRVGQTVGAKQPARLRPIGIGATGAVVAWMVCVVVVLLLTRETIAGALTDDADVFVLAVALFLATAFMQLADGLQSTAMGALRGMLDVRVPTLITIGVYWLIALPTAYVSGFVFDFGPGGVWLGYGIGIFIAAFTLQARFWHKTAPANIPSAL